MNGSDRANSKSESGRSSLPDQVYTSVIIALALFLVCLAIFRPDYGEITVNASSNYTRQNDPNVDAKSLEAELTAELTSSESMQRALGGIREDLLPPIKSQGGWGPLTERLAENIQLEVSPVEDDENLHQVEIISSGPNEAFQWQLVSGLQQRLEELHNKPVDLVSLQTKFRESKDEVASAVGILDFTQSRIDDFVAERLREERVVHEQQLTAVMEKMEREAAVPVPSSTPEPEKQASMPVVESVNPNWRYLMSQEEQAAYGSIDNEIMSLEAALSNTPKIVSGSPNSIENPFVEKAAPKPSPTPEPVARELALSQLPRFDEDDVRDTIMQETDFKRLMTRLEEAKTAHNAALDKLKNAQNPESVVSESIAVVQTPTVTERKPGEVTANRSFSFLIPSILIGLVCAWFRNHPEPPETFVSPEDVEEWLDLPVVGAVTTGDGPRIPALEAPEPPPVIRIVRRVAEVTVCAAMLLIIVAVVTVSNFGQTLINDPFTAYAQAIANVGNLFG